MSDSPEAHALIVALKELALELGRVPTRYEFQKAVQGGNYRTEKHFRTYTLLCQAAGLDTYNERRRPDGRPSQVAQTLFDRDVCETVSAHEPAPRTIATSDDFKPILVIGDCHFPFVHKDALAKIYQFAREMQPAHIVQMGDLYDMYAHQRFPRSLNTYSPDKEIELARFGAEEMWSELRKAAPDARLHLLTGNHDIRPLKKILMAAPELENIVRKGIEPYFTFDNVETLSDPRQSLVIQNISFLHGYLSQAGAHRDHLQTNVVTAHTHRGSVTYRPLQNRIIWELNAGFVGDESSKALSYTQHRTTGWTLGFGYIDKFGPRFIPL